MRPTQRVAGKECRTSNHLCQERPHVGRVFCADVRARCSSRLPMTAEVERVRIDPFTKRGQQLHVRRPAARQAVQENDRQAVRTAVALVVQVDAVVVKRAHRKNANGSGAAFGHTVASAAPPPEGFEDSSGSQFQRNNRFRTEATWTSKATSRACITYCVRTKALDMSEPRARKGREGAARARNSGHQRPRKVASGDSKTKPDQHRYVLTSQNGNAPSGFDSPHLHYLTWSGHVFFPLTRV